MDLLKLCCCCKKSEETEKLLSQSPTSESERASTVVISCIKEIERKDLTAEGIYRISGRRSLVEGIKETLDKNLRSGLSLLSKADTPTATSVLKVYLRELPEPLFTTNNYKQLIEAVGLQDENTKEEAFIQIILSLPDENRRCIVAVVKHLARVSTYESQNRMPIRNLARVFVPSLLHPAVANTYTPGQLMEDIEIQIDVLSYMLELEVNKKLCGY